MTPTGAAAREGRQRRALLAAFAKLGLGSIVGLGGVPMARAADLRALMRSVRASVLPVGTFDPLASPRFGFRGTGFVVGDGRQLITSAHVLPEPGTVPVPQLAVLGPAGADGQREPRRAAVQRVDRAHDLALLGLDGAALQALELAPPATLADEGVEVALVGYPIGGVLGFTPVLHRGIVAAVTRIALPAPTARQLGEGAIARLREGAFPVYQLDATAYPGNSGGPMFDAATGQVAGIVSMVLVRGTRESALSTPTGITYAVPSRFASELLRAP